jgi:hypothetical protein
LADETAPTTDPAIQARAYGGALEETTYEAIAGIEADQDDAGTATSTTLLSLQTFLRE